jgi:hypothetical protein
MVQRAARSDVASHLAGVALAMIVVIFPGLVTAVGFQRIEPY